jgi:predicted transposase YbfD/YdcC
LPPNSVTSRVPDLLDQLAETKQLEGALVSIDAMGCQVEIADKIVAHKADCLLSLKGNQPTLEADVGDYFRTACPIGWKGRGLPRDRSRWRALAYRCAAAERTASNAA